MPTKNKRKRKKRDPRLEEICQWCQSCDLLDDEELTNLKNQWPGLSEGERDTIHGLLISSAKDESPATVSMVENPIKSKTPAQNAKRDQSEIKQDTRTNKFLRKQTFKDLFNRSHYLPSDWKQIVDAYLEHIFSFDRGHRPILVPDLDRNRRPSPATVAKRLCKGNWQDKKTRERETKQIKRVMSKVLSSQYTGRVKDEVTQRTRIEYLLSYLANVPNGPWASGWKTICAQFKRAGRKDSQATILIALLLEHVRKTIGARIPEKEWSNREDIENPLAHVSRLALLITGKNIPPEKLTARAARITKDKVREAYLKVFNSH